MPSERRYGEGHSAARLYVTPRPEWDEAMAAGLEGAAEDADYVEGDGNLAAVVGTDEDGMVRVDLIDEEGESLSFTTGDKEDAMEILSMLLWQHITL